MRKLLLLALLLCLAAGITPAHAQEFPDSSLEATITRLNQIVPNLSRPDRWQFQILFPSTDSAVMCPLVPGFKTDTTRQPFVVSLFYGETEYIFHAAQDASVIEPCDPQLGGIGMQPLPTDQVPAVDACRLSPSGEFANIRVQPDVEADQLFTLEGERLVLGRNGETTWWLIQEGWVANTVVNISGD